MSAARLLNPLFLVGIACAIGWYWRTTGTPLTAAALYGVGFAWTVVVPGWVLHRLVAGRPREATTDLAMGAAFGVVASTFVWLLLLAPGWQEAYVLWPLFPVAAGLATGRRRVLALGRYERRAHPLTMAGFAVVSLLALVPLSRTVFGGSVLPPSHNGWYHDSYWHMGLVWELGRAMPPQDPQIAGPPFWYHWFANAHVAAQAHVAGVDPVVGFLRLWQPFFYLVVLALVLVAARELTGRLWPGLVAGLLMAGGTGLQFGQFGLFGLGAFNVLSPSHQYVLVPMLLCLIGGIQLLRSERRLAPLVVLAVGALGAMGGKGSALPVVICGLGLALVVAWFRDRARVKWLAAATSFATVAFGVSMVLTASANAGTSVQLFSSIRASAPWVSLLGGRPISLEPVLPGLQRDGAVALLLLILASYVVMYGATWLGLPLLRRELSAWYLLGVGFAGFAAMQLVNQDGLSQVYFMSGALPAWLLLAAAGFKVAWDRARTNLPVPAAVALTILSGALGWLLVLGSRRAGGPLSDPSTINLTIATSMATFLVGLALLVGGALFVARRLAWLVLGAALVGAQAPWSLVLGQTVPADRHWLVAVALAVVSAAALAAARSRVGRFLVPATVLVVALAGVAVAAEGDRQTGVAREGALRRSFVSTAETEASLWAREHLDDDALLATNVHCSGAPTREFCDARGFWVAGLTGHRVLVGGWAYTPEAHEAHGVGGRIFAMQPYSDAALFALNEAAFLEPTPAVLDELRARGVTTLFGSLRHNDVSEDLGELADEVFRNTDVVIYSIGERA